VQLPVMPPLPPMLAKPATELPDGEGWLYEPKWDGFRCIVFRDGDEVVLTSRKERPFNRYFPELVPLALEQFPERCVVDGEIVIPTGGGHGLDFDALLNRIHPAESRVRLLAATTPASFVAFDLLAIGDRNLLDVPLAQRRQLLVEELGGARPPLFLTPATTDLATASDWFRRFEGAGLDGVIAKPLAGRYTPDERSLVKVKHRRTADCVVAGYRVHKDGQGVGSFLLGLYDDAGRLQHVGVATGFTAKQRAELLAEMAPLTEGALPDHPWAAWAEASAHQAGRLPGAGSRWNAKKDLSWVAVRPERVAEVQFDQLQGNRFRHATTFRHWRPDRDPHSCTYAQLDVAPPLELASLFRA
jgi:ATP-dependent DNA ligase